MLNHSIDYCYCTRTGIKFTIMDSMSNKQTYTTPLHPRLQHGTKKFYSYCHKNMQALSKDYLAGLILLTLSEDDRLVAEHHYSDYVIPKANAGLTSLAKSELLNLYNLITYASYRKGYTVRLNLEELVTYHAKGMMIRAAILMACGQDPDELTEAEKAKALAITAAPKLPIPKADPSKAHKMPSMNISAIIKRVPNIVKIIIDTAPHKETADFKDIVPRLRKALPSYQHLSRPNQDRLQEIMHSCMVIGVVYNIFNTDSVEYKSLKHMQKQFVEGTAQHTKVLF